jgi:hypothetical protein
MAKKPKATKPKPAAKLATGKAAKPERRTGLKGTAAKLEVRRYGRGKLTFFVASGQ